MQIAREHVSMQISDHPSSSSLIKLMPHTELIVRLEYSFFFLSSSKEDYFQLARQRERLLRSRVCVHMESCDHRPCVRREEPMINYYGCTGIDGKTESCYEILARS